MTHPAQDSEYRVWHPWSSMLLLTRDSRFHLRIARSAGSYLYSSEGFRFLDGSSGLWNTSLGHGRADIIGAICESLSQLTYLCNIGIRSPNANDLAELLLSHAPTQMKRVMFHSTGTAAVEGAVLLMRQYNKMIGRARRTDVIAVDRSYHGCSLLGVTLSGSDSDAEWFDPLPPGFHHIPAPDGPQEARESIESLIRLIEIEGPERFAAFVFEPIMGVAGVIVPPDWWISEVVDICKHHDIKVIADEVTTGLGRVGSWFACENEQIDAIALGKGISGGYIPLAASLYTEELFEPFQKELYCEEFKYGSTMDGYPAACAAGVAVVSAIERLGLVERARSMGAILMEQLRNLEDLEIVGKIRGRGMMIGVPLLEPGTEAKPMRRLWVEKIIIRLMAAGLLVQPTESTLSVLPPLTATEDELTELVFGMTATLDHFNQRHSSRARNLL